MSNLFASRHFLTRLLVAVLLVVACWTPAIDRYADQQVETALQRALVVFGLARGLNAVISVAQGTQIAVEPAGLGLEFAPGQILDPVNDVIEQFSLVMLAASVSLGLQKLLLGIGGLTVVRVALSLALLFGLWSARRPLQDGVQAGPGGGPWSSGLLRSALALLLLLRFAVPLATVGSELAYRVLLEPTQTHASEQLQLAKDVLASDAKAVAAPAAQPDAGWLAKAQQWATGAGQWVDVQARLSQLQEKAGAMIRAAIDLIAVFILQSVIFPLLFLWLMLRVLRLGIGRTFDPFGRVL